MIGLVIPSMTLFAMTPPLDDKQQTSLDELLADAIAMGNLARVELCIKKGASLSCTVTPRGDWNAERRPLVHYAYEKYNKQVFEALVSAGMPLETKNGTGDTVLSRAVASAQQDRVEHMLALGANPLAINSSGQTILARARTNPDETRNTVREKILDALLAALPSAGGDFAASAKPAEDVQTAEDVVVGKPISLAARAKKEGFSL
jgi:hypothetical protein